MDCELRRPLWFLGMACLAKFLHKLVDIIDGFLWKPMGIRNVKFFVKFAGEKGVWAQDIKLKKSNIFGGDEMVRVGSEEMGRRQDSEKQSNSSEIERGGRSKTSKQAAA
ncbi:hypothetical protein ACFX1X_045818 [Malus domestica]